MPVTAARKNGVENARTAWNTRATRTTRIVETIETIGTARATKANKNGKYLGLNLARVLYI